MALSSKENVVRAIEFKSPERIPVSFGNPEISDVVDVAFNNRDENLLEAMKTGATSWVDEWGVLYHRPDTSESGVDNKGSPADAPLAAYENIDDYPHWPDAGNMDFYGPRYKEIRVAADRCEREGKYLRVSWFTLFERGWMLDGMEQFFMNLVVNPDRVHAIIEKVKKFRLDFLENMKPLAGRVHGLYTGDDWGTQQACYMSVGHFREFFKDAYAEVIQKAHSLEMHVWMHSCGYITDILEEFVDIGLDVINPQQPLALGIDAISEKYRGRICFEVPADIQKILPVGMATNDEIAAHVAELIEKWGTRDGGIVGMDYGGYEAIGTTKERADIALDAFRRFRYSSRAG